MKEQDYPYDSVEAAMQHPGAVHCAELPVGGNEVLGEKVYTLPDGDKPGVMLFAADYRQDRA
jgi:hypothetical protein